MSKVLVIGCGGVASVAIQKCCQNSEVFTELCIASRTKSKCDALKSKAGGQNQNRYHHRTGRRRQSGGTGCPDRRVQPDLVMNIALPYQDLTIMDACLECGVNYMDTANYEPGRSERPRMESSLRQTLQGRGLLGLLRLLLAVGLQGEIREGRSDRSAGFRLRPGRYPGILRIRTETPVRHHRHHRHSGLQRWRPWLSLCNQLQPRNQPARGFRTRLLLGERQVGRDSRYEHQARV